MFYHPYEICVRGEGGMQARHFLRLAFVSLFKFASQVLDLTYLPELRIMYGLQHTIRVEERVTSKIRFEKEKKREYKGKSCV